MRLYRFILTFIAIILLGFFVWSLTKLDRYVQIAAYSTSIGERTENQKQNLYIASNKINGYILRSGEVFSFNEIVGERLKRLGYMGAPAIYHGKIVYSVGGGLCQLSSTVYNVALLAGFEVIERSPHAWTTESTSPGRDAAIVYGKIDLKFRNKYEFPAKFAIDISENRIDCRVYALEKPEYNINIETQLVQIIPFPRHTISNNEKKLYEGKSGYKVKTFRTFSIKEKIIKKELISVDRYEPIPGRF